MLCKCTCIRCTYVTRYMYPPKYRRTLFTSNTQYIYIVNNAPFESYVQFTIKLLLTTLTLERSLVLYNFIKFFRKFKFQSKCSNCIPFDSSDIHQSCGRLTHCAGNWVPGTITSRIQQFVAFFLLSELVGTISLDRNH